MSDARRTTRAAMAALIQSIGCLDAVAATIAARWGEGCSKGTISRKLAGSLDFTLADLIALEDATGRYPVTHILARRLQAGAGAPPVGATGDLRRDAAEISREVGEAVAAILSAQMSASGRDEAQAIVEIDEALVVLRRARARLDLEVSA